MHSQKQKCFLLSLIFLGWAVYSLSAQQDDRLIIDPDVDAQTLVSDVFASGACETIFNIASIGSTNGIGFFSGGSNIVGFDRGIILSTGNVGAAAGPNDSRETGGAPLEGRTGDIDLRFIAGNQVYDRVGLEFDFVPLSEEVTFRYVFASEEYCEFVGSEFNDVFGFFVSGPGLNGGFSSNGVNVALVPGTNDAVSINTVNHTTNEAFYIPNERTEDQILCDLPQVTNPLLSFIEYDGLTTVLTATFRLQTCETYHMRLVIADVSDESFDSAVLLEAGSFDLGGSVSLSSNEADSTTTIYEGCEGGGFRVVRGEDSDPEKDQTIAYRFGENSEAEEGVDFINPGGSVTIPAGEMFADVIIPTISDGLGEGPERIWIYLDIPCACYSDSLLVILAEPEQLVVNLDEAYYCPDEMVTLNPAVSGGSPPYSYQWSTGDTMAVPILPAPLPLSIGLRVTDACGQMVDRSIPTFSSVPPAAKLPEQSIEACWGESRDISVELSGAPPIALTYRRGGNAPETIVFDQPGIQSWTVTQGGVYELVNVRDQACNGQVSGQVPTNFYRPVINPSISNPSCHDSEDGTISINHLASVPPYRYDWTGVNASGLELNNLPAGTYSLTITDALGCEDDRTFELKDPSPVLPVDVTCSQIRRPPLMLTARGGQGPYEYSVDGRTYWSADEFDQLIPGQYYDLFIRDVRGCEIVQSDFFYPLATPRNVVLPNFVGQELGGSTEVLPDYRVPYDQVQQLQWYPAEYYDCANCRTPTISAPFSQPISLVVTDIYGCKDSLVTWLGVDGRVPAFIPDAFSPNGDGTNDFVPVFANQMQVERVVSFRIFTRWGTQVYADQDFLPNSARRGWDGQINGSPAPLGTYVWVAEFRLTNGDEVQQTGSVVLVR